MTVAGHTHHWLLDSGSQVSFVTEAFFKRAIQPQGHELRSARNWLTIRAADGLDVPYVGYFETDVCVAEQVVADEAILVVRDASQSLPGLLGMNVLAHIPRFADSISHLAVPDGTKFARERARQAVCVPAQTTAYVKVVGGFQGQTALLEPMATGYGPLLVTSAVVQGMVYFAAMVNPTEKDFWVQPGNRIGIVQPAKVLPKYTGIVVNANEIVVGTNSAAPTSSEPSQLPIDLTVFEGTDQELQDVKANLRLCVHGNDHAVAPAVRRRKLPCVPSVISESESDSQSAPLLYTVQPPHDGGGSPPLSSHSDHHSSSSELSSSENEDRPLPRRSRAGCCHSNPGNWPRSVNGS